MSTNHYRSWKLDIKVKAWKRYLVLRTKLINLRLELRGENC